MSHTFAQKSINTSLAALFPQDAVTSISNSDSPSIEKIDVNTRVVGAFVRTFDNATNVNWSKLGKNFLATFRIAEIERRALFTKKGNMLYSIVYGTEADLPLETRKLVKSVYLDYTIATAIEVKEDSRTIWVVRLEDPRSLIFIRVEDGEIEQTKHYQKSK
jgi:hypothetical protein